MAVVKLSQQPDDNLKATLTTSRRFVVVLGLLTGVAALSVDMSLPSIPEMVRELETSMSIGQQVISLFIIGVGVGQLPAGFMSDRYGRLPILYIGVITFTVASAVTSMGNQIEIVLAARFFQGVGASVGVVITRAIVRDVASGRQMARLMSALVMIFAAIPMLAPIIGSFIASLFGWRMPYVAMAIFGLAMLYLITTVIPETHTPVREIHIVRQFGRGLREYFSHRQSIFGTLLVMLAAAGFISMITTSAALIIDIFGIPVQYFGFIFAIGGIGMLTGSSLNRYLLHYYTTLRMTGTGAAIMGIASAQLLFIAWYGSAPLWWIWACSSLYMVGVGFLLPNATSIALDPVQKIAGMGSSLVTALQNVGGSLGSFAAAIIYDGSISRIVIIIGSSGAATAIVFFAFRRLILGKLPLHAADDDIPPA